MAEQKQQKCWSCQKACGGCSWSEVDLQTGKIKYDPVPGWNANKVPYRNPDGSKAHTYEILDCPEYVAEPERHESTEEIKMILLERVAELYKDGHLPNEIADLLSIRTRKVLGYLEEAREAGLL